MITYPVCQHFPFQFREMGKKRPPEALQDKRFSVGRNFPALHVLNDRLLHLQNRKGVMVPL